MTALVLLALLGPIPAADGTFTGCYQTTGRLRGALRVIDAAATCRAGEARVTWSQRGPQGPSGSAGPPGAPGANALRAAQKRWYPVNGASAGFPSGVDPMALAFDGASMWVANYGAGTVAKLRASDGQNLGSFPVGRGPLALAFDGANVWVANQLDGTVSKLRASDGLLLGTFPAGVRPTAMAFDGAFLWVASEVHGPGNPLQKLRPSDGSLVASYGIGGFSCTMTGSRYSIYPMDLLSDGEMLWVLFGCYSDQSGVARIRPGDGTVAAAFEGNAFVGMQFDGANLWVASWMFPHAVYKLRKSDASVLCAYTGNPAYPFTAAVEALAFDGLHLWSAEVSADGEMIRQIDPATCALAGEAPGAFTDVNAFDGVNVWTACDWSTTGNTVCKR